MTEISCKIIFLLSGIKTSVVPHFEPRRLKETPDAIRILLGWVLLGPVFRCQCCVETGYGNDIESTCMRVVLVESA